MRAFKNALVLAVTSVSVAGCDIASAQSILPGEWEVIETRPKNRYGPREPNINRHCISKRDAQKPTLRAMINLINSNYRPENDALVENGRITGNTRMDTPDRDFRGIPIEIEGTFNERSFSYHSTIRIMDQDITTIYEGRHIGHCNGRQLGSGWQQPRDGS